VNKKHLKTLFPRISIHTEWVVTYMDCWPTSLMTDRQHANSQHIYQLSTWPPSTLQRCPLHTADVTRWDGLVASRRPCELALTWLHSSIISRSSTIKLPRSFTRQLTNYKRTSRQFSVLQTTWCIYCKPLKVICNGFSQNWFKTSFQLLIAI